MGNLLKRVREVSEFPLTSIRHKKELWVCSEVLSEQELANISSLRVGYKMAKDRLVEDVLKEQDPDLYYKVKKLDKVPIFDIEDLVRDFKLKT